MNCHSLRRDTFSHIKEKQKAKKKEKNKKLSFIKWKNGGFNFLKTLYTDFKPD